MEGTSSWYVDAEDGWRYEAACELLPSEEGMSRLDEGVPLPCRMRVEQRRSMRWWNWKKYFAISGQLLDLAHKESEIPGVDCADPDLW